MLPRVLGLALHTPVAVSVCIFETLIAQEAAMDHARRTHAASWRAGEHVLLLAALLHEAQLLDLPICQAVA
jgi:hypothetical protein